MKSCGLAIALLFSLLPESGNAASICFSPHCEGEGHRAWAFETGIAIITDNNINDFTSPGYTLKRAHGPGGGRIYSFTASRRLGELRWEIGDYTFTPQLEVPLTLEIVNENARSPFGDLNASFMVRWVDFPWNDYVKTSFGMGVGLSYSEKIYLIDIERHPDQNRSNMKINWPIQLALALPAYPEHQLTVFIAHQSGGRIFDEGGVNSLGFGYRHDF